MIRLGLRLTVNGGREAAARLIILVVSVGLGVGLLLIAVAGLNAVNQQNGRYAWLETSASSPGATSTSADPLWWLITSDSYGGQVIGRIDVAATGPSSPVPPGISHLPGPGEYYASPALARLLRSVPADQLADRFPGREIGVLGNAALPAPDSLLIVVGYQAAQLSKQPGVQRVTAIDTTPPSGCSTEGSCNIGVGMNADAIDLVLSVIGLALLIPVLVFVASATRLSAARREQRFAAMRLTGATPGQISVIAAVESVVASLAGTAVGFGIFFLLRAPLAAIPFTGAPFFPADLSLSLPDIALVGLGVPVTAAVAALLALRRVNISPLGVTRRVTPRAPSAWRVLPLLAGIADLAYWGAAGVPHSTDGQIQAFVPGFALIMIGLVVLGPWLTMTAARLTIRHTRRPAALIAARRLSDNPKAAFRSVSGLVLALFITTVAAATITTIDAKTESLQPSSPARGAVTDQPYLGPALRSVPDTLLAKLNAVPGVTGAMLVYADPASQTVPVPGAGAARLRYGGLTAGLVSCAQLDRVRVLGHCPAGAAAALFPAGGLVGSISASTVWPAAAISRARMDRQGVLTIVAGTNGSTAAIERTRTVLDVAYPYLGPPVTVGEFAAQQSSRTSQYQQLADVIILTSLPIAGCTLAASIAGSLADRKRPFSLLRLAGAPLSLLRRMVALESAVPLLVVAVVSIGAGFVAAGLFLNSQMGYDLAHPGAEYYVTTLLGIVASLAIIAATMPLLSRITGPEVARNE